MEKSSTILEAYRLLESIHKDSHIRINTWEVPYIREVTLFDFSLDCKGDQEDRLYTKDTYYRDNVRRGNTLIQVVDKSTNMLKTTFFARKGLKKFFDIREEYLDLNLKEIDDDEFSNRLVEENNTFSINDHFKLNKIVFTNIRLAYDENEEIEIFKLLKANGENCQIAWIESSRSWVIASKNVSLLVRSEEDIDLYLKDRFQYAKLIAHAWFMILERIEHKNADINALKFFLKKHTLIGEYVGNPDCQHLIQYREIDILFFAIVNNNIDEECLPPLEAFKIFGQYHLSTVRIEDIGTYKTFQDLNLALKHLNSNMAVADIELEQEGCVLYFLNTKSQKVVSLAKMKTLEYRIFRKLREILRNFIKFYDTLKFKPFESFQKDVEALCKRYMPPRPLEFYYKIFQFSIDFIDGNRGEANKIHAKFITFLSYALYTISTNSQITLKTFSEEIINKPWSNYPVDAILKYEFKNQRNNESHLNVIKVQKSVESSLKKKLFLIIPIMLPGSGKSFFIPYLHESLITEKLGSWEAISSDKIRKECMGYFAQKNTNTNLSEDKLFEITGKSANQKLTKTLEFNIKNIRNSTKENNFLFIDKNHPPDSFRKVIENAKNMCPKNVDMKIVALYPDCPQSFSSLDGKHTYPFSLNYFFTCLYRVQNRTDHETLKGKQEKSANVMLMYLQLYQDCQLNPEALKSKGFDIAIKVDLTAEQISKDFDPKLTRILLEILEKTEMKKKCESIDLVHEFVTLFDSLNLEFPSLSKTYLIESAKKCIKNCLKLSSELPVSTISSETNKEPVQNNLKNPEIHQPPPFEINQSIPQKKLNTDNALKINIVEKYIEEEKTEPPTMDRTREYNPRVIPTTLGIYAIDVNKAKPEILSFIRANLTHLKNEYPEDNNIAQNLSSLTKTFIFPRTLHVTSLYIGSDKTKLESKYYKTFEDGLKIKMNIEVLLYIPDMIFAGLYFPKTEIPMIEHSFPHIILMIGGTVPDFAYKVLRTLFEGKGKLRESYEQKSFLKEEKFSYKDDIVVDRKKYVAYLSKIDDGIVIEGETAGSVDLLKSGK